MGLMLGGFVDDYTVRVVDVRSFPARRCHSMDALMLMMTDAQVFAMPQSGTGVSVEAVDPVFQTKMMDMLKQTGRLGSLGCHLIGGADDGAQIGNSCRLVSLASRLRVLAIQR